MKFIRVSTKDFQKMINTIKRLKFEKKELIAKIKVQNRIIEQYNERFAKGDN